MGLNRQRRSLLGYRGVLTRTPPARKALRELPRHHHLPLRGAEAAQHPSGNRHRTGWLGNSGSRNRRVGTGPLTRVPWASCR
eukprot:446657-Alexandrium_andersonii.AAC.1